MFRWTMRRGGFMAAELTVTYTLTIGAGEMTDILIRAFIEDPDDFPKTRGLAERTVRKAFRDGGDALTVGVLDEYHDDEIEEAARVVRVFMRSWYGDAVYETQPPKA